MLHKPEKEKASDSARPGQARPECVCVCVCVCARARACVCVVGSLYRAPESASVQNGQGVVEEVGLLPVDGGWREGRQQGREQTLQGPRRNAIDTCLMPAQKSCPQRETKTQTNL